jgi:Domain of unknown function (DUF4124)
MRYVQILMGTLFCLLVQQDIHAQTLYTWQDDAGTIHITQEKPPARQLLTEPMRYTARLASPPPTKTASPVDIGDDAVLTSARRAKQARQKAQTARQLAEDAIQEANQIKTDTERFIEPWRGKKRIRKQMQLQIESRIQKANQMIATAEQRIDAANAAEKQAQIAEKKAQRMQDQFFEAYKGVISQ